LLGCVHTVAGVARQGRPTPAQQKTVAACMPRFEALEAESDEESPFKPATLTPLYRTEVHQMYLANGIKVFENKELAAKIGEAYTNARLVERRVAEIETRYNDGFMQRAGELEAVGAELEEVLPEDVDLARQGASIQAKVEQAQSAVKAQRQAVLKIHAVLELEAVRLKELLEKMDAHFVAVAREIDQELARQR
jgi:hypothetical protein